MTEYTLAQVIDKLGRNPNLKFQFVRNENYTVGKGDIVHLSEDGFIVNQSNVSILSKFTLCSKFRLVNEPVDRMTAFRAFEQGKTICCELNGTKCAFIPIKTTFTGISVQEILHGKWFIEEGN